MRFLLCLLLCGCTLTKQDGLYINHRLVNANGTVEDYCKAEGRVGLFDNGKEMFSK